jgi:hypothetical protein
MDSNQKEDAGQVIQEALQELKGTSQEGVVILAQVFINLYLIIFVGTTIPLV